MMTLVPFTPPHVSVNRVKIVDLPGLPLDDEVRGRAAYELLSSLAVVRYARQQAESLHLPSAFTEDSTQTGLDLPCYVDRGLASPNVGIRAAAESIAVRLGRNLGYILLTLLRGDAINRAARPDWTAGDWERWAKMERVCLGGGLMRGQLGCLIVQSACALLAEMSCADRPVVELTPYGEMMALLGAGRYFPASARDVLCFDFGHTTVKRACLRFEDGMLVRLRLFEPQPRDVDWLPKAGAAGPELGQKVLEWMTRVVVQTFDEAAVDGVTPGDDVMLSVAAYVQEGRLLGNGLYANLSALADDARPLLADAVLARTGRPMRVHLIHDGTAACALYAGSPNTAVIVVGTALGIGFPPADASGLRRLSPNLILS